METNLVLWWHHHQPWYLDPRSGEALLPWVRLHACRGYLDMATAAADASADRVRHTFNFVPSLLDQLVRYGEPGKATDLWLDLSRPAPGDLSADQRALLLHRMGGGGPTPVRSLPRLQELRARVAEQADLSDQDLRDLQVLAHLGFCGWTLASRDGPARELMAKGSGFTEAEKHALLDQTVAACAEVISSYRELAASGRAEITATPYFHPILPLLVDSDCMAEALPDRPRPTRYARPDDARRHVVEGLARVQAVLGTRPAGMWPAEGSVSTAAVELLGAAGVTFCGTDESVLRRSKAVGTSALDHGRPWLSPDGRVAMFFRDHAVSDLLGFSYRHMTPEAAAADLLARVRAFGSARARADEPPVMTVILDGENPWEHYPEAGRPHLLAMQAAIGKARHVKSVTPSEHLAAHPARARLASVHAGSWIDGTFNIWIGHAEDRQGWQLLGAARAAIDDARARGVPEAKLEAAMRALMPAQGSDWFWWFGDEFQAREADLYDALFRRWVSAVYVALDLPVPASLEVPIKRHAPPAGASQETQGFLADPKLTAALPSHADWAGAIRVSARTTGAMARASGPIRDAWAGITADALWLCVFPQQPLATGTLRIVLGGHHARTLDVDLKWKHATGAEVASGDVVTVRWPLDAAGVRAQDVLDLHVELDTGTETQRIPSDGTIRLGVPDGLQRWRAAWA